MVFVRYISFDCALRTLGCVIFDIDIDDARVTTKAGFITRSSVFPLCLTHENFIVRYMDTIDITQKPSTDVTPVDKICALAFWLEREFDPIHRAIRVRDFTSVGATTTASTIIETKVIIEQQPRDNTDSWNVSVGLCHHFASYTPIFVSAFHKNKITFSPELDFKIYLNKCVSSGGASSDVATTTQPTDAKIRKYDARKLHAKDSSELFMKQYSAVAEHQTPVLTSHIGDALLNAIAYVIMTQ